MKIVRFVILNANTARLKCDVVVVLPQVEYAVCLVMHDWHNDNNVSFPMYVVALQTPIIYKSCQPIFLLIFAKFETNTAEPHY